MQLTPWSAAAEDVLDGRVTSLPPLGNRLRARREKETNRPRCLPGVSLGAGHDQTAAPKSTFTRVADRGPCDGSNSGQNLSLLKSHCPVACVAPFVPANAVRTVLLPQR